MKMYGCNCRIRLFRQLLASIVFVGFAYAMEQTAQNAQETDKPLFSRLLALAEANNKDAQYIVGDYYQYGKGDVPRSVNLAKDYFQRAASQGHLYALQRLGFILLQEGKRDQAVVYLRQAAEGNERLALYEMSKICCQSGAINAEVSWLEKMVNAEQVSTIVDDNDYNQTVTLLQSKAACRLGEIYESGASGVHASRELAISSYKKSLRFQSGNVRAKERLACLEPTRENLKSLSSSESEADGRSQCLLGKKAFERRDFANAVDCFRKVAADREAQYYLGLCLESGLGLAQDRDNALAYFRASAEQGYAPAIIVLQKRPDHAGAQCILGKLYRAGRVVPKDEDNALRLLLSSYKLGCAEAINELNELAKTNHNAQYAIGLLHEGGQGCVTDIERAIEWYKKAALGKHDYALCSLITLAENGVANAALALAEIYEIDAYFKDYEKSREWLITAVDAGSGEAAFRLGNRYSCGVLVPADEQEGLRWFVSAAELGHQRALELLREEAQKGNALAQYALGVFFQKGRASRPDLKAAEYWLNKAAGLKHAPAFMRLAEMEEYRPAVLFESLETILNSYNRIDTHYKDAAEYGLKEAIEERKRIGAILEGFQNIVVVRKQRDLGHVSLRNVLFLRLKEILPEDTSYETYYWAAHICGVTSHYYTDAVQEAVLKALQIIAKNGRRERTAYAYLQQLSDMLLSSVFLERPLWRDSESFRIASIFALGRRAQLIQGDLKKIYAERNDIRSKRALIDFLIDSFNQRTFSEERVDEQAFRGAVDRVLRLFDSLQNKIKKIMLYDEKSARLADVDSLCTFLHHSKTNRFRQNILKISQILTTQFTPETAAKQLCEWAIAGLYSDIYAEEHVSRFIRAQAITKESLDAERLDLEMRVAICLAEARRNAIEGLVKDGVPEKRLHAAYMRAKARQVTSLIGVSETVYNRAQESLVSEDYKEMLPQLVVQRMLQNYDEVTILVNEINKDSFITREMISTYFEYYMGAEKASAFLTPLFCYETESKRYLFTNDGARALLYYFGYFE